MLANSCPNSSNASAIAIRRPLRSSIFLESPRTAVQSLPSEINNVCGRGPMDLTFLLNVPPSFPAARGGYSDVYKGTLTSENGNTTDVAVKVVRLFTDLTENEREPMLKRFCKESLVLTNLSHPGIAKFYGVAIVDNRPALVLQWYEGGTARDYLQHKGEGDRLTVVIQVASGLEYLHRMKIVHGDVKGTNVLVTSTGRAVLTDFGVSRILDAQTGATTSSLSGTLLWQAPETVVVFPLRSNMPPVFEKTRSSDVWAFACTAFELISGRAPYSYLQDRHSSEGSRYIEQVIARSIKKGVLPCTKQEMPICIHHVLKKCWRLQPSQRPEMSAIVSLLQ